MQVSFTAEVTLFNHLLQIFLYTASGIPQRPAEFLDGNRLTVAHDSKILGIALQRPLHGKASAKHGSTANRNHQRRQQV